MNYVNEQPANDREKRVFGLSIDLMKQDKKMKEAFDSLTMSNKCLDVELDKRVWYSSNKRQNICVSIESLINVCVVELFRHEEASKCKET